MSGFRAPTTRSCPTRRALVCQSTAGSAQQEAPFNPLIVALGSPSTVGQATGTSQLVGDVVFATPFANAVIQIRNFAASGGAVTVTPLPGGTQAQAVSLIIEQLA